LKRIDNVLYIESDDIRDAGINENTALAGRARGSKIWEGIKDPACLSKSLYRYESMSHKYQKMIHDKFGDPYVYESTSIIKNLVATDFEANKFYLAYRYQGTKCLPIEKVTAYTTAASWLNMLIKYNADKKYIKTVLNLPLVTFYEKVGAIIKTEGIEMPSNYKWLRKAMEEYQQEGYSYLIHGAFGNTSGVKVKDELSESILFEMIAHPNQFDDVLIAWQYNIWCRKNNAKEITPGTVGNYRRRYYDLLIMQREGNEAYINTYGKSIKGYRPTQPTFFWESDDNHTDYYFVNWEDKTQHKYFYTYKSIFVTDSFCDLVLGYAVGEEITIDLVKAAYRNAMHFIKKMTGGWYLPHETKSDRWGLKTLQPFYESMGNYAPTPKGSKKRGYLEQFFGSTHWERAMKIGANNYTGHNVTAKTKGVNREVLHANRNEYPTIQEAPQYFADLVTRLRLMPPAEGQLSKQQQWMNAWEAMPAEKKKLITDEEFLLKFGIEKPLTNKITDKGIDITINGIEYNYDIPDEYYYEYKGASFFTLYDPMDMSRVLLTDKKNIRFIATAPHLQSRAMADAQPGDRARLNQLIEGKKRHVEMIADEQERRTTTLQINQINIDKLLTEGMLLKEERQLANEGYQRQLREHHEPERRQQNPLSKM
jgi:hypothetical protein